MLGFLIERIRKDKGVLKVQLASQTHVNTGHLTHIENGSRNPSHKVLKSIANALGVPCLSLFTAYDKDLTKEQFEHHYINYIPYSQIPAISKIDTYVDCPTNFSNASFAYKAPDNAMAPVIKENSYVFVELNGLIDHKEIGLFRVNGEFLIRKLIYKKDHFVLKAVDKNFDDITISDSDDFQIIGKVYI